MSIKIWGGEKFFAAPSICINFLCFYLQQPPPNPKSGPPFPPLQQQRRSRRTGSKHPHPQILSIMPHKHPFLHKQIMRMIISIQRQQLSPIPKQFNILCISSCKIRSVSAIIISIFFLFLKCYDYRL